MLYFLEQPTLLRLAIPRAISDQEHPDLAANRNNAWQLGLKELGVEMSIFGDLELMNLERTCSAGREM